MITAETIAAAALGLLVLVDAAIVALRWKPRPSPEMARRMAELDAERAAEEEAKRRYAAALTAFAAAANAGPGGAEQVRQRREDAVTAGRAYYDLCAADGVFVPYEAGPDDMHWGRFDYGPQLYEYRDSFIEADLAAVEAGLRPAMSWSIARPNDASRRLTD